MVTTRLPASLEPSQVPINFHDGNTSPMIRLWSVPMSLTMALYRRKLKRSQPKKAWVSVEVFGKTNVKDMKVMLSAFNSGASLLANRMSNGVSPSDKRVSVGDVDAKGFMAIKDEAGQVPGHWQLCVQKEMSVTELLDCINSRAWVYLTKAEFEATL